MKKILSLTALLPTLFLTGFAQQQEVSIRGMVMENPHKPLEAATVNLLKTVDSSTVKMTASDKNGKFIFTRIAPGNYLVGVTAIGKKPAYSSVVLVNGGNTAMTIPDILLIEQVNALSTVTVSARKPPIEQKIDRTIVNVDAAVTNAGASALEVLEKSPGISVDKDGNISLKGKQGVMVMIDGKPAYLSGAELVNLLRNMNANQLEQIEIMTNPSAKYDAAGNAGIINIKTKKNKQKGFNGSLTTGYSQGKFGKTSNSLNMNYRNGKLNAFANLAYNQNNRYEQLDIVRKYKTDDKKTVNAIFQQTALMKNTRISQNAKAGLDVYLSKHTTLGIVGTGFINPSTFKGENTSYLKNGQGVVDSIVYSTSKDKERWKNGAINLNFRHQFDSSGKELSADVDYAGYASTNRQEFTNTTYKYDMTKKNENQLLGLLPIAINIFSAKADYTQNLTHGLKLETGWKSSFVKTTNTADYFNLSGTGRTPDYTKTNNFRYTENINAAYVNVHKQMKKLGVQTGLRFENTAYTGVQGGNPQHQDSSFRRTYNNLFPTLYLSYAADKNNQFGLNTGKRIDRPAYQDLNPFLFFLDNYTYAAGNPYLKPQYTANIELSHTYKGIFTTTVNYSKTRNFFMNTFEQQGYATIVRDGNIGVKNNAGISISAQIPLQKWWTAVLYSNYNYSAFSGNLYGEQLKVAAGNLMLNINNQLRFNKGWSAELSGWYRTKGIEGQILLGDMGQVSAGVSRQVLKSKGSVRFNIKDVFYTQKVKGSINFQQTEATFRNTNDTRVANVTFSYRFGKPLKDVRTRKTGATAEEQSRVKLGGN